MAGALNPGQQAETVELPAQCAPKLRTALRKARREKMAYVVIDGMLIPIDRIAVDWPFTRAVMNAMG